ncbi:class I SAM-dependent methyltransferase [Streptomyces chartreusis]|uniref:class I SAM-dependent methyltransferase n=1 Tax=Streptomyces chartreusis TaxID=1969 RepID=UPI002F9097BC|nr:class I SAM-dependent methyltransferase [Streptomyces chartreusis]WTA33563.1 class I SAM-dependent methyltransferase [Streptomyces chartreusis]
MTETAENHFDTTLSAYARWCDPCSGLFSRAALDGAALPARATVLDVCAGMGALAVPAAERGHTVRAIDTSVEMVRCAAERLKPYPKSAAGVMDALDLQYGDNEFDAAFSVLGVVYFGPATVKALSEMVRVVRPGGLVSVMNWADPMGAPFFIPVARAVNRMDDPEVGTFVAPLTEYLERSELEQALSDAGCIDARSERVEVAYSIPTAETFMDELDPVFQVLPQYRAAVSKDRDRFREILFEEVSLIASGELPPALGNIAYAQVPSF